VENPASVPLAAIIIVLLALGSIGFLVSIVLRR
jgi:preprotein translocase subunit Sss1